jgi:hypothetical protein
MPGTVDDFMQRFGGSGTMDESEAAQYHDRFVSNHSKDRDFDNNTYHQAATQYLGKLPDDQFHQAAQNAVRQTTVISVISSAADTSPTIFRKKRVAGDSSTPVGMTESGVRTS